MYVMCLRVGGMRSTLVERAVRHCRLSRDENSMRGRTAGDSHQPATGWDSSYHAPALVGPVVELLGGSALVLDGTLGGGGHSAALLDAGVDRVIGVDRDPDALAAASARLSE